MSKDLKEVDYTSEDVKLEDKRWLTPLELEKLMGWSRSWQSKARMMKSSNAIKLPFKKVGKFVIYDRYQINAFIEEHQVQGV